MHLHDPDGVVFSLSYLFTSPDARAHDGALQIRIVQSDVTYIQSNNLAVKYRSCALDPTKQFLCNSETRWILSKAKKAKAGSSTSRSQERWGTGHHATKSWSSKRRRLAGFLQRHRLQLYRGDLKSVLVVSFPEELRFEHAKRRKRPDLTDRIEATSVWKTAELPPFERENSKNVI